MQRQIMPYQFLSYLRKNEEATPLASGCTSYHAAPNRCGRVAVCDEMVVLVTATDLEIFLVLDIPFDFLELDVERAVSDFLKDFLGDILKGEASSVTFCPCSHRENIRFDLFLPNNEHVGNFMEFSVANFIAESFGTRIDVGADALGA